MTRTLALALVLACSLAAPAAAQTSNWFPYNGNYEAHRFSPYVAERIHTALAQTR